MLALEQEPKDYANTLSALPKLGVGLSFQAPLQSFVEAHLDTFDFLEIIPDTLWNDLGSSAAPRYQENRKTQGFLEFLAKHKPIIAHSIGLSIGSADWFDRVHVAQIAKWQRQYHFPWHSDHLSFSRLAQASGHLIDVGLTMPVPYDAEVLDLLVERVNHVHKEISVPFLLENNVYYFEIPSQEMSEAEFLNQLTARTGCGLLLDLHNVYVNACNHSFDPWDFLSNLDLTKVVEIHLAGGMMMEGFYLDAHSGVCPEAVWQLLEELLPKAPNVAGIVFEVFGTHYHRMGSELLKQELSRAKTIWKASR
ncbi:DUF692 domain-containing protein [Brasilonema octagenarum]|uniref:DUF692 domain-containing protein n=1 Tax=Brasilonema octagenarum UFV-OR1 TaxID=417115 RepID=A0ABX1M7P1_9CYAN|nr:DUF692 domain-containing protein [Brasilonema octagenarum]NMF63741.1 hypothetical protein [Brasilonema octagenarum UFV-OR1]